MSSGPPNKFPIAVNLSSYTSPSDIETALSNAYAAFYTEYGVYPTVAIPFGVYVFLGGYGS